MTQFMLIERRIESREMSGMLLSSIDNDDELLIEVALEYFGRWRECRLVTDAAGSAESLVDDVCDAQSDGHSIEKTAFVRMLRVLVESGVRFVIWHGSDYLSLPIVRTWNEVLETVRSQTQVQPADLYLCYAPPDVPSA